MLTKTPSDTWLAGLTGQRLGPYCSFNPVSRVQVWQWCSAMGDKNPLYLDENYRSKSGFDRVVAPPAMMQVWTMRDINDQFAPGSSAEPPYQVFDSMLDNGYPGNVAVSYDIRFHRYLVEGDRVHHYTTIVTISERKSTALGEGYFVTERVEYLDQHESLFAEALITYFQYRPAQNGGQPVDASAESSVASAAETGSSNWQPDYRDIDVAKIKVGDPLPQLIIPITHKLIVGGAIATQDFIPVHHNVVAARAAAMPDIFMNILTTSGLSARYLSDWAGPASRLQAIKFRLLAPNTPGDSMVMQGRVAGVSAAAETTQLDIEFAGKNSLGLHVSGSATLQVP